MNASRLDILMLLGILLGSAGLYTWWSDRLAAARQPHWGSVPPELPGIRDGSTSLIDPGALRETRERPLFWESRRATQQISNNPNSTNGPIELLGIVFDHDGPVALARSSGGPIKRLRAGDGIGGATIHAIGVDSIQITGPSSPQTLKLKRGNTPLNAQPRPATR
ncbi:MAG: hypothetical protein ACOZAQ_09785 [Pseudomonadota bacterium]